MGSTSSTLVAAGYRRSEEPLNEYSRPDGAWSVRVADGGVITQPGKSYRHSNFLGWLDDEHYVISDNDEECNSKNLRTVAVADGTTAPIFEGCYFSYDAFSPENGAVLLSSQECDRCPLGEGTFLLLPGETEPRRIWDERAWEIDWRPESGVFDVYPHGAVSANGQRFDPPMPEPTDVAVSMQGWVAWLDLVGQAYQVAVGRPGEEPTILEYCAWCDDLGSGRWEHTARCIGRDGVCRHSARLLPAGHGGTRRRGGSGHLDTLIRTAS